MHGRHIGIMPLSMSLSLSALSHFLVSDQYLFKVCINFMQSLEKGKALLNTGQVPT